MVFTYVCITSLVFTFYKSSSSLPELPEKKLYGFHSCFSIFSRLKLEHSKLIYESLWISVLKQLQPGFLFFSSADFC